MLKIEVLTPLHISSGKNYELGFNALEKDELIYLFDEFKITEFFIKNNIFLPDSFEELKNLIDKKKYELIENNIYVRKIENYLKINKAILEHISTQNHVFIPGSSIKGAIRTAYINKLIKRGKFNSEIVRLEDIKNKLSSNKIDYKKKKELKKEKENLIKTINQKIDKETKNYFKYLKVGDTVASFKTQIFKSINIKKEKDYQKNRTNKVEKFANFVETIIPNQKDEIFFKYENYYFNDIVEVCNEFYKPIFEEDVKYYFCKSIDFDVSKLSKNQFLLNIGRFSGAEAKSIQEIRVLAKTGANTDFETTTKTFALDKNGTSPFFEKQLQPFGWVLCEIIE